MSFDRVAPYYGRLETLVFGRKLQAARTAFVRQIGRRHRALVVGEGDGRFLKELRRTQPGVQIECLDASARMLTLARARAGDDGVQYLAADVRVAAFPAKRYDLIVTHFFLDCFEEPELTQLVQKLSAAATDNAIWLVADFHVPATGWRRRWAQLLVGAMYLFFRIAAGLQTRRLVEYAPCLQVSGFALTSEVLSAGGLIRSQRWERRARPG